MDREREWQLIGGHLALDLCNTVAWRSDPARRVDRIAAPGGFAGWFAHATGHPGTPDDPVGTRSLRDALGEVLDAHVEGTTGDGRAGAALGIVLGAWRAALAAAELVETEAFSLPLTLAGRTRPEGMGVHHFLALSVGELLFSDAVRRVRRCEGPGCGWFFLDTTRNHSRRWCDPADCGNRVRVRAYAQRRRSGTDA
ncbi:CGNR zinc finger domain-containing protein [Kineosporia sp. NBRC 101731]|uniref:CGNR zinc finger domain-containing protein n=1 Tax=Kineosporia sp. NBRC 101731 TaxID=3032199 RepID=UPI0024A0C9C4|nr:CGNR zinc finger domain-containing protein [Kineosporia sp. NBRC 101731]GLY30318.1 hypothetical protein Kisp02_36830 [Kineosporia sp. NBRC 101731]